MRSRGTTGRLVFGALGALGATILAAPSWAQPPSMPLPGGTKSVELVEREQKIQLMEQALEAAVTRGMQRVEGQLPGVPGLVFFAGSVRARGFELQDYGVFFDVEYPVVRRSILWSMGTLQRTGGIARILEDLRRRLHAMPDGPGQAALARALAEMEASLQAFPASAGDGGGQADARPANPVQEYLDALTGELVSAMILDGGKLGVAADQWLAVAARDGRGRIDPRMTADRRALSLRIRGRDLEALREGTLSADEARERVESR